MKEDPKCASCGGNTLETVVRSGSYVFRCATCGHGVAATSFLAFRSSEDEYVAYRDQGHGQQPIASDRIASGRLKNIYETVWSVVKDGDSVLLVHAQQSVQPDYREDAARG